MFSPLNLYPHTPLTTCKFLTTEFIAEHAKTGTAGLYFETRRAIVPVSDKTIIKSMLRSRTVYTAEEAIASAVPRGIVV